MARKTRPQAVAGMPDSHDCSYLRQCFAEYRPFPATRMLSWAVANIVNDQGRPYDHLSYPHLAAPGGPMDAFDDPRVRTISQQFATRLGKTFFGLCALLYHSDKDPAPMLLASESQDALKRVMGRIYKMVYARPALNDKLLIRSRKDHKQDLIKFKQCDIRGAWARSAASLADVNIKVGLANEVDKDGWSSTSTTREGEPLKLFDDRFKDYQSVRKIIYECTPTVAGASRIERLLLAGWNCRYYVPCPHCRRYQILRLAARDEHGDIDLEIPGRIHWDRTAAGKHDRDLARSTACYICERCGERIYDDARAWMMRRGVWVPEGCGVDDAAAMDTAESWCADALTGEEREPKWQGWSEADWVTGDPNRSGPDASYQLSSLYALSLSWGDIAAEFVACHNRPQYLRNFINQWLGETWQIIERRQTWEQLGGRLIRKDLPRSIVPEFASLVTVGVDRQKDRYVYTVDAWGPDRTSCTIEYGDTDAVDEIVYGVASNLYKHADGGDPLRPALTLIDSGYKPEGVYEACYYALAGRRTNGAPADKVPVLPCKGSNKPLDSDYRKAVLGRDTSMPGLTLVHVDTIRTQTWIDNVLHKLQRDDPGGTSVHAGELDEHQDFLEQLLNDAAKTVLDPQNNEKEVYERISTEIPNDFRDCRRYSYVAMLLATRGRPIRPRDYTVEKKPAVILPGKTRRDGRAWTGG